jgi:hypothetical protein
MDGNYKSIYPTKKPSYSDEQKKKYEEMQKGAAKGPDWFERIKEWMKKKKEEK